MSGGCYTGREKESNYFRGACLSNKGFGLHDYTGTKNRNSVTIYSVLCMTVPRPSIPKSVERRRPTMLAS